MTAGWTGLGHALFLVSGLVRGAILIPVQMRQHRMARGFAGGGDIPACYWRLGRVWLFRGVAATLLPLAAIPVMVWKIP